MGVRGPLIIGLELSSPAASSEANRLLQKKKMVFSSQRPEYLLQKKETGRSLRQINSHVFDRRPERHIMFSSVVRWPLDRLLQAFCSPSFFRGRNSMQTELSLATVDSDKSSRQRLQAFLVLPRFSCVHHSRLRLEKAHLRRSRTSSCVQLHRNHASPPVYRNPLARLLVFSTYDSCAPNTTTFPSATVALTESQRSFFYVSVQELHGALLADSTLASPSTWIGLTYAAANLIIFAAFVLETLPLSNRPALLAAPQSTVISTISCTKSTASNSKRPTCCLDSHSSFCPFSHVVSTSFASVSDRIRLLKLHDFSVVLHEFYSNNRPDLHVFY